MTGRELGKEISSTASAREIHAAGTSPVVYPSGRRRLTTGTVATAHVLNTATRTVPAGERATVPELGLLGEPVVERRSGMLGGHIVEGSPADAVTRRDRRYRRTLAGADMVAYTVAIGVSLGTAGLRWTGLLGCVAIVLVGKLYGLYDRDALLVRKTTLDEAPKIFHLATLFVLMTWLLDEAAIGRPITGREVVGLWATAFVFDLLARWAARAYARRSSTIERCMVIASPASVERITAQIERYGGGEVVASIDPVLASTVIDCRAGTVAELRRVVDQHEIHRIVLEPNRDDPQATLDLVRAAKGVGARVSILPHVLEVVGTSVERDDLAGMMLLGVRQFGLTRSSAMIKRTLDLAAATAGLVVLSLPLALIALAIKLDSRGAVLFRQRRIGRDGRPFQIIKFRTMVDDAERLKPTIAALNEADGLFKIAEDPRITRIGRLLRRTSLDELPQLINVLRGEMSLVGPRPLIAPEDAQIAGWDRSRLALKPGMTGHWQIAGSSLIPLSEMVKIDYLYVTDWSLWGDCKILLRTVPYVLARRGL